MEDHFSVGSVFSPSRLWVYLALDSDQHRNLRHEEIFETEMSPKFPLVLDLETDAYIKHPETSITHSYSYTHTHLQRVAGIHYRDSAIYYSYT